MSFLLILCAAAIPIGTRFLLGSVIPGIHEYESIVLYGSDLPLVAFICLVFWRRKEEVKELFRTRGGAFMFAFLIAAIASVWMAPSMPLGIYSVARLVVLIAFAYAVGVTSGPVKVLRAVLATIGVMAVLESLVGIMQFAYQESIGLQLFGEPILSTVSGPASTIVVEGGRILRAYGTFPHPNILAGFLALGLISLAYFYLWCEERLRKDIFNHARTWWNWKHGLEALVLYLRHPYFYLRLLIASGTFMIIIGLALSLSRSGWLASAVGLLILCVSVVRSRANVGGVVRLVLMIGVCAVITYSMFAPIITPRTQMTLTEPAVSDRLVYGKIGLDLFSGSIGGVGAGNQVLFGVEHRLYQERGLVQAWGWEPVHNLYLLVGVELGWLGLLSFLAFLGMVAIGERSRMLWKEGSLEWVVVMALFFALLVAGLFDHYLWTMQSGKLMLWLVIGLALSQSKGLALSRIKKERA